MKSDVVAGATAYLAAFSHLLERIEITTQRGSRCHSIKESAP